MKSLKKWYSLFLVLVISVATIVQPIQVVSAVVADSVLETTNSDEAATEISESNQKVETESIAEKTISTEEIVTSNSKEVEKNKGAPVEKQATLKAGKELNHAGFVDSISFEPKRVLGGKKINMIVTFDSKDTLKVLPGDKLTLTLPDELTAYYRENPVEVFMNGVVIGYAIVEEGKNKVVTIEFNDVVNDYQFITGGKLEMEVATKVLDNPSNQNIEESFSTDLGTDATPGDFILFSTPSGTGSKFFSKIGTIYTSNADQIYWFLRTNGSYEGYENTDHTVLDTLQVGQYRPNDFMTKSYGTFYVKNPETGKNDYLKRLTAQEMVEQGYLIVNIIDDMTTEFIFRHEKITDSIYIDFAFITRLTDEGKLMPEVENKAVSTHKREGEIKKEDDSSVVNPPSASGVVYPGKGILRIMKVLNTNGKNSPLSGVVFDIFYENGQAVENAMGLTTDEKGQIVFPNLSPGNYYAIEKSAPDNASFDPNKKYEFTILDDDKGAILPVVNYAIIPEAKLEATKTADKKEVKVGDVITYTINATNTVKDSLLNPVVITDELPEGLELVKDSVKASDKDAKVEVDGNNIQVTFNNVTGESSVNVTFEAKVTDKAGKTVKNVALVEGTDPNNPDKPVEPGKPEVETPVKPVIPTGKLEAMKTADKKEVKVGDVITYTINATNTVKDSLLNPVVITDELPEGLELVKDSVKASDKDAKVEVDGNNIQVTFNNVTGESSVNVTFEAKVTDKAGKTVKNVALVEGTDPNNPDKPVEPGKPEVETPVKPVIPTGKLEATKTADKKEVKVGDVITYTINATNTVKDSLLNPVVITDELPEGLELVKDSVKASDKDAKVEVDGNNIQVTFNNVTGESSVNVTFEAKVTDKAGKTVKNVALVEGTDPNNPDKPVEPKEPEVETPVKPVIPTGKLDATKTADKKEVKVGDVITYTINATNTVKDSLLNPVVITDNLPEGLELVKDSVKASDKDAKVEVDGNNIQVTFNNVAGESSVNVTFEAKVTDKAGKTVKNVALVEGTDPNNPDKPVEPKEPEVETPVKPVIPTGKLDATKTADKKEVKVGDVITYTINATNTVKNSLLNPVVITDNLPEGLELVKDSVKASDKDAKVEVDGNNIQVTFNNVAGESSVNVTFEAKVTDKAGKTVKNVALVEGTDPNNPDKPVEPKEPEVETPVKPVIPTGKLDATKTADKKEVKVGDVITYTINATNTVKNSLLNPVVITDNLPEGLELVKDSVKASDKDAKVEVDGNNIQVTFNNVAGESSVNVTFEAKVTDKAGKTVRNVALVEGTDPNNPDKPVEPVKPEVETPVIPEPVLTRGVLEADKLVDKKELSVGDIATYTIIARNIAENSEPLKNVVISDNLPKGLKLLPETIRLNGKEVDLSKLNINGNNLSVTVPSIEYGKDYKVTFDVKITEEVKDKVINIGKVTTDGEEPEEPEVVTPVIPTGKLEASKTVDKKSTKVGETLTYTIKAKNTVEGSILSPVVIKDVMPKGLELVKGSIKASNDKAVIEEKGNEFIATFDKVTGGQEISVTFQAKVTSEAGKEVKNVAIVEGTDPENPDPEKPITPVTPPEVVTPVIPTGKLEASKTVDKKSTKVGETLTYTIKAKNTVEGSTLSPVVIKDVMPKGLELVKGSIKASNDKVVIEEKGNEFIATFDKVTGGQEISVTFQAKVTSEAGKEVKNVAIVEGTDPENPDPEKPITPVTPPEVVTPVIPTGKLEAEKLANQKTAKYGDIVTYTIVARNTVEGSELIDVVVEDALPVGVTLIPNTIKVDGKKINAVVKENQFKLAISSIKGGEESKVTFEAKVTIDKPGTIRNIAVVTDPADPENPEKPVNEIEVPGILKPTTPKEEKPKTDNYLPKTGEKNNLVLAILGSLIVLISFVFFIIKRQRKAY